MAQQQQQQKPKSPPQQSTKSSEPPPLLVGVYGTLKRGHGNHVYLTHHGTSKFVGEAKLAHVKMVSLGGFPACCIQKGAGSVHLEVFEVDEDTLKMVDGLEGHPRWYVREQVKTPYGLAWVYFMQPATLEKYPVVEDGVWPLVR